MGMLKAFKDFAMRSNVIDMAVGVIIGFLIMRFYTIPARVSQYVHYKKTK